MKKKVSKKKASKKAALYMLVAVLLIALLILFSYRLISDGKRLSNKEISAVLEKFPYKVILDGKDKVKADLTDDQVLLIGYYNLKENQIVDKAATEDCFDKYGEISARCEAKELGLSEEKINKLDTNLWKNIINYSSYSMFSLDSLKASVKDKLGLDVKYNESFYKGITLLECGMIPFVYDNNVDMLFSTEGLGCTVGTHHVTHITSGYKNGDIYEIYLSEGTFVFNSTDETATDGGFFSLSSRSNPSKKLMNNISYEKLDNDYERDLIKKYRNDLDKYKLTFEKDGDTYKFISIDYLG